MKYGSLSFPLGKVFCFFNAAHYLKITRTRPLSHFTSKLSNCCSYLQISLCLAFLAFTNRLMWSHCVSRQLFLLAQVKEGTNSTHFFLLRLSLHLEADYKASLFYYLVYFCYYSWVSLYFLVLFISLNVLFQLTLTFIYSTFSKKFSVSIK